MSHRIKIEKGNSEIPDGGYFSEEVNWLLHVAKLLFVKATPWAFHNANIVGEVRNQPDLPNFIMLKVENPIDENNLQIINDPIKIPFGKIYSVHSASLLFAYLIETPKYDIKVSLNYVTIIRPSSIKTTKFTNVKLIFENEHLSAFYSEDGILIFGFTGRFIHIYPETLRGGVT